MARAKSKAFERIRAEVIRLVGLVPVGKFTTYGSLATHMNVVARHVAFVLSALSEEEAATLPWHRVLAADARQPKGMPPAVKREQRKRLAAEGMTFARDGCLRDVDAHFHSPGPRRNIRWSHETVG